MRRTDYELWTLWKAAKQSGQSKPEFALAHGLPAKTLEAKLRRGKLEEEFHQKHPEVVHWDEADPWTLTGDWMVVGDVHVPYTLWGFASLVAQVALKHMKPPRRLLIAGDLFSMDVFSSYPHETLPPTWAQERDAARALITEWLTTFDEIRVLPGNHDVRLFKQLAGAMDTDDLLALIYTNVLKVKISPYGFCYINDDWIVTHQRDYSKNQLWVANALAHAEERNVMSFHEHHLSKGWDEYKNHVVVNGGCLVDERRVPYTKYTISKRPRWARGFVMLRESAPYVFGEEPFTDWSQWLPVKKV